MGIDAVYEEKVRRRGRVDVYWVIGRSGSNVVEVVKAIFFEGEGWVIDTV